MTGYFRLCPGCRKFFFDEDTFIRHSCGGHEPPPPTPPPDPETEPDPAPDPDADARRERQRRLRRIYLDYLKEKNVDMRGARSFRKIEQTYRRKGGKSVPESALKEEHKETRAI